MLWLCIILPRWPLEALHSDHPSESAVVVTACTGAHRWIVCCNPVAADAGLRVGMNCTMALAIHPALQLLERSSRAEQRALERLAAWACQFSTVVIIDDAPAILDPIHHHGLWVEIGASLRMFGGLRNLITRVEDGLRDLGYCYQLGIAPTLEGAALLARAGIRLAVTTPHALLERIRPLSLSRLALAPQLTAPLHTLGLRSIGALLELPRAGLRRRFGAGLGDHLDRLTGMSPDPRRVFHLPEKYHACLELGCEVAHAGALRFPLQRLLREFAGFLRARDTGVQQFTIVLKHRQHPETRLRIGLLAPERNAERLLALAGERLDRTGLPASITALILSADRFVAPGAGQSDLLGDATARGEALSHTIDRLTARLGDERVHGLKIQEDHRPEAGWACIPFAPASSTRSAASMRPGTSTTSALPTQQAPQPLPPSHPPAQTRPLWLLPEPQSLRLFTLSGHLACPPRIDTEELKIETAQTGTATAVPATSKQNTSGQEPGNMSGPERIESGWWDGGDVRRDYYLLHTPEGSTLWVYHDLNDHNWYLHGFWS